MNSCARCVRSPAPLAWSRHMLISVPMISKKTPDCAVSFTQGIEELEPQNWVAGLEQTMLIVLVLGRWLMPKGDMTRDQLSQLLMAYVGLGADILDIFDTFKEPEVENNRAVVIVGLALFSWALMQFPLVLTQKKASQGELPQRSRNSLSCCREPLSSCPSCCSNEVWSLLLTVGLQDAPFLVYRLYLMIKEQVQNQLMIFFTCKNILIVLLELYRIFVVQFEQQEQEPALHRCGALVTCVQTFGGNNEEQAEEQESKQRRSAEQSRCTDMEMGLDGDEDHRVST
uniref:Transmembrane protein 26 n=1 Tax=Fundulus heteroclitus TaxID=8078 RepID=A0A3Q2PG10_FUNHE